MTTCCSCGVSVLSRRGPRGPNTRQGRAVGMPGVEPFIGSRVSGDKEMLNSNLSSAHKITIYQRSN